jgi:predicted MPP superfamily phosphohydrolase
MEGVWMKTWARRIGWGLLLAMSGLLVHGVFIEPRFLLEVEREEARVPALPEHWEGQQVAVVGDFQVGLFLDNERAMHEAVRRIIAARPALVLIVGDFVYDIDADEADAQVARALPFFRPLVDAGLPTFAVLGNHDYGIATPDDAPEPGVADALASAGISVLRNEAVSVSRGGEPLYLVGVDSRWARRDRPGLALREVPPEAPRLVFMHHPDSFTDFPAGSAPFAVAGHTHGGQVRVPFLPHWSWRSLMVEGDSHTDGWIAPGFGAPGNRLYVTRGVGMSTIPVRINCPPEVTLFTLRRAAPP